MLSSKPLTFRIAARKAEEFAPPQAFCTGVTRSSAASSGAGRGRVFSQVPNRSIARFALSQSRSKTRPLATSASVTAAVASASSRIRLPDDQRSGRASSRWRPRKSGRTSTSPSMKTRNSASEVAIARFRIAFFRKPASSCQTWRTERRMRRRERLDDRPRLRPRPVVGDGDAVRRHRPAAPPRRGRAPAPAGSCRWTTISSRAQAPPSRSAPGSRAPPGPRPRRPRCSPPSAAPSLVLPRFAARFGPRPIFAASSASERV